MTSFFEFIVNPFFTLINFFIGLIPPISFPTSFETASNSAFDFLSSVSFIFPLGTLFDVGLIIFSFLVVKLVFVVFTFVWSFLPTVGSSNTSYKYDVDTAGNSHLRSVSYSEHKS